jgi:uncharacterized protein YegL
MVWVVTALVPFMGFLTLAVDYGNTAVAQAALQNYADAKALAHLKELFGFPADPVAIGRYVPGQGGTPDALPERGAWRFASDQFVAGEGVTLEGVPASRMVVGPGGNMPAITHRLFLGGMFGTPTVQLQASATAFVKKRHVLIVQDVSGSMTGQPMAQAKTALTTFVQFMADQRMPGDNVGLLSFSDSARVVRAPALLTNGQVSALGGAINSLTPVGGTRTETGINLGRQVFANDNDRLADKIMILVSDGAPNVPAQANAARNSLCSQTEIQFNTIRIGAAGNDQPAPCNFGKAYETPSAEGVRDILVSILSRQKVRLVE